MSHGRDPEEIQSNQDLFTLFGFTNKLENRFSALTAPSYREDEIKDLKKLYDRTQHDLMSTINGLLDATISFRISTDPQYKVTREQDFKDTRALEILNKIGAAITGAENKLNDTTFSKSDRDVLYSALDYCLHSVKRRLKTLEKSNDKIRMVYDKQNNELKNSLAVKLTSLRPR